LGDGVDGFADDRTDIRHWVPSAPVEGLAADAVWLDIDAGQQVAALRRGKELLYVTVVSSGTSGRHATPLGIYELTDKTAWGDMASRAGADEVYHVENVPWVAHFWPRYALHGAFWHWGFGNRASHGCINLAPRDAIALLEALEPLQPLGWHSVYATDDHPGAVIRIRDGLSAVRDKR
ncbi:MAG: L,D-transpeptidase, partial [Proteobacteria bacterium]|nr:L,D-transpeptidase [Pseudomonadota bacterium]